MARYTIIFIITPLCFFTGCSYFTKDYFMTMVIYNDCNMPIILHNPAHSQGEKLEVGDVSSDTFRIARRRFLSDKEHKKIIDNFLKNYAEFIVERPDGQNFSFSTHDILARGERPYVGVVDYYLCKNYNSITTKTDE